MSYSAFYNFYNTVYIAYPKFKYLAIGHINYSDYTKPQDAAYRFLEHVSEQLMTDDYGWILIRTHQLSKYEIYNTKDLMFKKIDFNIFDKQKFVKSFDDVLKCLENEHKMDVTFNNTLYPDLNFIVIH